MARFKRDSKLLKPRIRSSGEESFAHSSKILVKAGERGRERNWRETRNLGEVQGLEGGEGAT